MNNSVCDGDLQASLANPGTRNDAAAVIYQRYSPDMLRFAKKRMQHRFSSRLCLEDVMQSTWKSFHGCVNGLRITDSFWPYLFTILRRKLSKASERHTAAKRDVTREARLGHLLEKMIAGRSDPDLQWLRESINELDGFYRQVIQLRIEGYSQLEIAALLGKSVKFVQRYQQSAIDMLRTKLAEDQNSCPKIAD